MTRWGWYRETHRIRRNTYPPRPHDATRPSLFPQISPRIQHMHDRIASPSALHVTAATFIPRENNCYSHAPYSLAPPTRSPIEAQPPRGPLRSVLRRRRRDDNSLPRPHSKSGSEHQLRHVRDQTTSPPSTSPSRVVHVSVVLAYGLSKVARIGSQRRIGRQCFLHLSPFDLSPLSSNKYFKREASWLPPLSLLFLAYFS